MEVDGVLAWVGGRRRQGEARHRRQSLRVRARCALPRDSIRFDSIRFGRLVEGGKISEMGRCNLVSAFCVKRVMRTEVASSEEELAIAWTASSRPVRYVAATTDGTDPAPAWAAAFQVADERFVLPTGGLALPFSTPSFLRFLS